MAEHKMTQTPYIYGPTQANQITSVGVLTNATDIAQGVQSDERIGDKITTCSLGINITCNPSTSATIQPILYNRLLIFIWKDDATPVLTDIFEDITKPWLSFLRYDNKVKRKILYDKMWAQWVEGANPTSAMVPTKLIRVNLNLSKIKRRLNVVNYQPASGNATNHLYYIIINNSTVAVNTWDYQIIERITWIDM